MSIAAIYDIHGNLPALQAVLQAIRQMGVDEIVVGGDVVPGPLSQECLQCLVQTSNQIPVSYIRGNGERAVCDVLQDAPVSAPDCQIPAITWVANQLTAIQVSSIQRWPLTLDRVISMDDENEVVVTFCHATPRDDNEIFTVNTPASRLRPVFEPCSGALVICGHTHMQFDRVVGEKRILNAGSVGMPFDQAGAAWLLIDARGQPLWQRTVYDVQAAADQMLQSDYPGIEDFVKQYVLGTPDAKSMLDLFDSVSI